MSFRLEKKFLLNPKKYQMILKYFSALNANKIYDRRLVFSTYFDNDHFISYRNSEEGLIPRKKIRIRSYNTQCHNHNSKFELKISSEINRFKKTGILKNSRSISRFLSKGYLDQSYGLCKPLINISYERDYFLINQCRITIDKSIEYWGIKFNKVKYRDPMCVLEFKSDVDNEININNNILFEPITRFSKYCRGMNKVFFNVKNY